MLMYASVNRVPAARVAGVVDTIVTTARARNASHGITGALLFTGLHFVQIVEGPAAAIAALWANMQADPRHDGLVLANHGPLAERRFHGWSLAYAGPAHYVHKRVQLLFNAADPVKRDRAARWLAELMYLFSIDQHSADRIARATALNGNDDDQDM
jgi:hypothetical protein